jgi:hypothetical protein
MVTAAGVLAGWFGAATAQPGPFQNEDKKGKGKKGDDLARFPERLARIRQQIADYRTADPERRVLLSQADIYANKADGMWRTGQSYIADRTLAAADALAHGTEHLDHLKDTAGPLPPAEEVSRNLAQVYFRTRQADYFLTESHESSASFLVTLSRQYYQRAVQSYDRSDFRAADEYGKTSEELVRALENLAQAATLPAQPPR